MRLQVDERHFLPYRMAMIRGIECMLALDDTRHFGAAAKRLGISQPSLSQAIGAMEHDLGLRLVVRTRSFEGFTPAGEVVIAQGRRVLRAMSDLREMVDRCRADSARRFAIGIIPITTFVAPLLSAVEFEPKKKKSAGGLNQLVSAYRTSAVNVAGMVKGGLWELVR